MSHSTAAPRRGKARRVFRIAFATPDSAYSVAPLACDPACGKAAWRFTKRSGDLAVYDVRETAQGFACECLGFLRWGHCKHVNMLMAARRVFSGGPCHA